jgi:hypothetical protein
MTCSSLLINWKVPILALIELISMNHTTPGDFSLSVRMI